jgi:SPP1 gp7 family putative phage head morphogenesis protein
MRSIDLRRQVKATGTKRKRIELVAIETTKAQADDLARLYMPIVRIWQVGCRDRILPAYRQALATQNIDGMTLDRAGDVEVEIEAVEGNAVRATFTFRGLLQAWAESLQLWHMRRFISQLVYASSVDLTTQIYASDVQETIEDVLARNVALVRDVSDQARGRIADIVFRGLQNRTPAREIAKEMSAVIGLARARSLRIASDQTVKLSGALDKQRQLQVGMTSFEWLHSRKAHPRLEHVARNGKIFAWSGAVGRTDPPGFAPFCGCKAKGVLKLD